MLPAAVPKNTSIAVRARLSYEQMGDLTRAVGAFTEVYGLDVGYRDVADRLQGLQARQKKRRSKS